MIYTIPAISSVVWVVVVSNTEGGHVDNEPTHVCMDHVEPEGEDILKDMCVHHRQRDGSKGAKPVDCFG
jgi:hypothetical protein